MKYWAISGMHFSIATDPEISEKRSDEREIQGKNESRFFHLSIIVKNFQKFFQTKKNPKN